MPKIKGPPSGTLTTTQVQAALGRSKENLWQSGLSEFLDFYQVGNGRLYLTDDVAKMKYWLFVREGLIALGHLIKKSHLLPPGETYEARRHHFEAWFDEDPSGTTCPLCEGEAVRAAMKIWCPECGVQNEL